MSEHTPGKLTLEEVVSDSGHIKHLCPVDADGLSLLTVVEHDGVKFAAVYSDDDARRLVAAWNACEGIPTKDLEELPEKGFFHLAINTDKLATDYDSLRAVNAELLQALEGVIPYMEAAESAGLVGDEGCNWPVESVRAAIARASKQTTGTGYEKTKDSN